MVFADGFHADITCIHGVYNVHVQHREYPRDVHFEVVVLVMELYMQCYHIIERTKLMFSSGVHTNIPSLVVFRHYVPCTIGVVVHSGVMVILRCARSTGPRLYLKQKEMQYNKLISPSCSCSVSSHTIRCTEYQSASWLLYMKHLNPGSAKR